MLIVSILHLESAATVFKIHDARLLKFLVCDSHQNFNKHYCEPSTLYKRVINVPPTHIEISDDAPRRGDVAAMTDQDGGQERENTDKSAMGSMASSESVEGDS